ncbi:MAG: KH domain-containing protein [Acidimicrobiaceae bacterium]
MSDAQAANATLAPTASSVLTHIVKSIVDTPDAVKIESVEDEGKIILEVRVAEGDLGRVIGRRGRTAQSIRAVVRAAASRDNAEVDVDFLDD